MTYLTAFRGIRLKASPKGEFAHREAVAASLKGDQTGQDASWAQLILIFMLYLVPQTGVSSQYARYVAET